MDAWDYQSLKLRLFELSGAEDIKQYQHEALKVGLKNGDTYIMDLAGAQYGHHASVVPNDTYFQTRAGSVLACQSFGHQQRLMKEACGAGGWKGAIRSCNDGFHQEMNASIDDWQDENISLSAMLKLPEKQFLPKLRRLVTFVDKYLRDYKQWGEKGGHFKMRQVAVKHGKASDGMGSGATKSRKGRKPHGKATDKAGLKGTFEEDVAKLLSGNHSVIDMRHMS